MDEFFNGKNGYTNGVKMGSNNNNSLPPAIVIGLDCITGLQTARILAQKGIPVFAIATKPGHFACQTRVCKKIIFADTKSIDFINALQEMASQFDQKPVLFPCTDMSVLLISQNRNRLAEHYHVVLPDHQTVKMLMDKIDFIHFAQREGLPIPETYFLRNKNDAVEASQRLKYPCILKPPMKTPEWERNTKAKVYKANNASELLELYEKCSQWAELLMVQQWVEGTDGCLYSFNGYFNKNSEPVVTFIARKIRQWPPETGTSCLGEECRNDFVLSESIRLLQKARFCGLGYVEFKQDALTGVHYIIEPNIGRPTGRSAISEAGGVELLHATYCDTVGLPLPENRLQKYTGVKWIYLRRDLQSAFYYFKHGQLSFWEWIRSLRGKKFYAVLSWSDPLPFWADFFGKFYETLTSKIRHKQHRRYQQYGQNSGQESPIHTPAEMASKKEEVFHIDRR
ncbi:hypothetical protein A2V82_05290 [candidate division KSB1 bacterium RBG_16_48_16]|nr:MAG: hypothetical protein A2V82_05290 [candidate division KSB1 bacterium RBG_16_48_16]